MMKTFTYIGFTAGVLCSNVSARWLPFGRSPLPRTTQPGCPFTISSTGSFACPVGELPDGQVRANGSESTATFYVENGSITDSMGYGCIVTAPPTTQIQCDQGSAPDPNFTIDSVGNLLYNKSAQFYACPATDTEYNIYINPNFGQAKCFPITLQASGCAATPPTSTCPAASTITEWQTQTLAQTVGTIITVTVTSQELCITGVPSPVTTPSASLPVVIPTASLPPFYNTSSCPHCTDSMN